MNWLNTALWNVSMSLLTHRNTRALLVPLICVVLLLPAAMCAEERRQMTQSTGFVAHSTATVTAVHTDLHRHDAATAGMIALAQSAKGSASAQPTAIQTRPESVATATPITYAQAAVSSDADERDEGRQERKRETMADEQQHQHRQAAFLGQGEQGVVPRKFTVPDSAIVAEADSKHIAILPAKPLAAVAMQHSLLKRDMIARSGVALVDTMVVVTVDGRLYGVNRYDGSIVWQRDGLGGPCTDSSGIYSGRGKTRCPRGMVWTKSSSVDFGSGTVFGDSHNNQTAWQGDDLEGDGDGEFDAGDDGDDEEEEWLLEQGIDWRSDPQVLERQRQQRREWLARQRKKARSRRHGSRYPEPSADSDGSESEDVLEVLYIAEPAGSGMLFLYDSENGLQRLPLTIQTLVDQSPVQSNGVLYTGNKDSNFASIDLLTGKLIGMYGDEHRSKKPRAQIQILLGERINRVRIYPVTGNGGFYNRAPQHELYHRFVNTPSIDPAVDAILTEIGDAVEASYSAGGTRHSGADDEDEDVVFQPQPHGPTKFVMTHDGGLVMVEAATGIPLWAQEFDAPVVSMFDVFSIASPDSDGDSDSVNYVARKRNLNPSAQQNRYLRWKRLYEVDDEFDSGRGGGRPGFGSSRSKSQQSKWRTGSAGGNILAESFWDRSATSHVHVAYVGRLQDTLYTLTTDEFPLVDHQTLTSSLLLALAQAKRNQHRYPAFQSPEWWDRWSFLTHDATVLRVLQDARAWWMRPVTPAETSSSSAAAESAIAANGAVADPHVGELMELVAKHFDSGEAPDAASYVVPQDRQVCLVGRCNVNGIIGVHPFRPYPAQLAHIGGSGAPTFNPYLLDPGAYDEDEQVADEQITDEDDYDADSDLNQGQHVVGKPRERAPAGSDSARDDDDLSWWRYIGHYMTRAAAVIGYIVTIAFLVAFVSSIYLMRPRNRRRPRMWIDADGEQDVRLGRRDQLRKSWALMHRMWDTLKEEWRIAVDEAWRNPNAAAVLGRAGVERRTSLRDGDEGSEPEVSRASNGATSGRPVSASSSASSSAIFSELSREDSEPASLGGLSAGQMTPRRNSTGALPMTPLKRSPGDGSSIERQHHSASRSISNGTSASGTSGMTALATTGQRLGAITLSDQVLGYGSHGTVVYRGEFQGRAVAVKRLLLDFYDVADHEVQVLQESDTHPNVIRYFCTERHDHFMYIALELCCGSLADAVMRAPKAALAQQLLADIRKKDVLFQLARGLYHLHALKLVHRDIKPQNILIAPPPHRRRRRTAPRAADDDAAAADGLAFADSNIVAGGTPRVLISDFGLSRILDDDESSFANTYTIHAPPGHMPGAMPGALPAGMLGGIGGGTVGWRAPECFDSPEARGTVVNGNGNGATNEPPTWPSLHGPAVGAADEPSPYVTRGTRSRLQQIAMTVVSRPPQQQQQQQAGEGDDGEDSIGGNLTSTTDRAGSMQFATGSRRRMTRAVDIFSMGCVFHYVLMDGEHPFGDRLSREQRILAGKPDLRALEASDTPSAIEATDLIAHMVARNERNRPSAASVLVHPYFWDAAQRLAFLQDVSDCLEAEARLIKVAREVVAEPPKKSKLPKKKGGQPPSAEKHHGSHAISAESIEDIIAQLPTDHAAAVRRAITLLDVFEENSAFVMGSPPPSEDGFQVVGSPHTHAAALESMAEAVDGASAGAAARPPRPVLWDRRLDTHLRRDLGKFRKYDGTRLRDLLRIIRNKKNHYQDMPEPLRQALGDIPDGYLAYFESRFPYLLLHCYYFVLEDDSLRTATVFRPYFRAPSL